MGIINDGAVTGRSLAVFFLETEGIIEEKNSGKRSGVESLERAEQLVIFVLALVSATEFLDGVGSGLLNYTS